MTKRIEHEQVVYLPTYDGCYVCGQNHPRGLHARFFASPPGRVQTLFNPEPTQAGYDGLVHGGVASALLDELLGWAVVLQTGRMCFTAELMLRFAKPMPVSQGYVATAGRAIDRGRYWESAGDLQDDHGEIYTKAHGKYFLLSEEQTAAVIERLTYQPDDLPVFRERRVLV